MKNYQHRADRLNKVSGLGEEDYDVAYELCLKQVRLSLHYHMYRSLVFDLDSQLDVSVFQPLCHWYTI